MENTSYDYTMVLLECNDINCKHTWEEQVVPERIWGNRLVGLETCPKCGRYDAPYVICDEL